MTTMYKTCIQQGSIAYDKQLLTIAKNTLVEISFKKTDHRVMALEIYICVTQRDLGN